MKIIINLPTLNKKGILIPWLYKWKEYQCDNNSLDIYRSGKIYNLLPIINPYTYSQNRFFKKLPQAPNSKLSFMLYSLCQNLKLITHIKEVAKNNYNVVISPSAVLDLVICAYILKLIRPNIIWTVTFDNVVPISDSGNKVIRLLAWFFFKISEKLIRRADIVFAVSDDLVKYLYRHNFSKKQVVRVTNGIENELIKKAKKGKKYNIDALFVGRINETKGIYDMLKALEIVRKKYPHFQLAIMGKGDIATEKKYKKEVKKRDLQNNIQFLGYKTGLEKFNIFKSSKCFWFLSKSKSESFGMALLEAVCCGLPAFAYNLESYREIYKNNEVMVFEIGDYQSVAQKVIDIFSKKQFHNEKGKALIDKYSWEKIAQIELAAIKSLQKI